MKAILRSGFLALAMMLALTFPANAGPLEDALEIFKGGRHGDAYVQATIGDMYRDGYGGYRRDAAEAARWYRLAGQQTSVNLT